MKLTANTITDEQIQDLRAQAVLDDDEVTATYCDTAIQAPLGSLRRVQSRSFCAETINKRDGGS